MPLGTVSLGLEYFPEFLRGRPVWNASIYIGEPDTDPTLAINQKTVTLRHTGGDTVVSQPIATIAGGVPSYQGSPAQILTDGNYSITVLDHSGAQIYYLAELGVGELPGEPSALGRYGSTTVTVGAGGDFANINLALESLSDRGKKHDPGSSVIVSILTGEVISETVIIDSVDLSWIEIQSVDPSVVVTTAVLSGIAFWTVQNGGDSPTINTLFVSDNGSTGYAGLYVTDAGSSAIILPNAGFNSFNHGAYAANSASLVANNAVLVGSGVFNGAGILAESGATVTADNVDVSVNSFGIESSGAGTSVDAPSADCNGCQDAGLYAHKNGEINAPGANCSGITYYGGNAAFGGTINMRAANCSGGCETAVLAEEGTTVDCSSVNADAVLFDGLLARYGARVNATGMIATNAGRDAITAENGSYVNAQGADASGAVGDEIKVVDGGIINANGAIGILLQTANAPTEDGIIFQAAAAGGSSQMIS